MVEIHPVPPLSEPCPGRDTVRQDGRPWVRLVLSLLLLGAPALALALDSAQDGAYLAGSLDQPAQGGWQKGQPSRSVHPLPPSQSNSSATITLVATPWRVALRHMAATTRTRTQIHHWVQPAPFSHGRVIDPARYLQRTLH